MPETTNMELDELDENDLLPTAQDPVPLAPAIDPGDPDSLDSLEDESIELGSGDIHRSFLTGVAGSGKTTLVRNRIAEADAARDRRELKRNPYLLCATTGVASLNMGPDVSTLHSILGFFNYDSLVDRLMNRGLQRRFMELAKLGVRYLVVDELSMLSRAHLEVLDQAADEAAQFSTNPNPCGIMLVGDFLQLPPIPDTNPQTRQAIPKTGEFAFQADCWDKYESNLTKLDKVWRQDNPDFLTGLNAARAGNGEEAVEWLQKAGVEFTGALDRDFHGTTIFSKNDDVDTFNAFRLRQLSEEKRWNLQNRFFGTPAVLAHPPAEWGRGMRKLIPDQFELRAGALVMLLVNCKDPDRLGGFGGFGGGGFLYVNGDPGLIRDFIPRDAGGPAFAVELERGKVVEVRQNLRPLLWKHPPKEWEDKPRKEWPRWSLKNDGPLENLIGEWREGKFQPMWITDKERWLHGAALWWPMRLAWASTVHKSQGLTLQTAQIEPRGKFWENPGSCYVALSRCRTPEGLRVVGEPGLLARRIKVDARVGRWI